MLVAAGDAQRHALVDALEPEMYFGATKFFDRAGHLPHAVSHSALLMATRSW